MSKKTKNVYFSNLNYVNLYKSYLACKCNKRFRKDVIIYSFKYEFYLSNTLNGLKLLQYNFSRYREFFVLEPKKRRILAAPFTDRIVHTWFVTYILNPVFEKQFIATSYACIKDRGMHKAAFGAQHGMRISKRNYENYYILKFDISKYFDNIDKDILINIIVKKIKDKNVIWLLNEILDSSNEYYLNKRIGIPIGNLTSQTFANIYLNELDQYIKHSLKCRFYYRYMDDGILLCEDKAKAKEYLKYITSFLKEELRLNLNKKTNIIKHTQGINFCGYYITEKSLKIRFKGKQKLKKKMKLIDYLINNRKIKIDEAKRYLNGHVGYMCHANVNNLVNRLFYT
jgi:retron-type reverse transcriptase